MGLVGIEGIIATEPETEHRYAPKRQALEHQRHGTQKGWEFLVLHVYANVHVTSASLSGVQERPALRPSAPYNNIL